MIERLTTGWTITRGIFLAMGIFVIIDAIVSKQYFGIAFGAYFASMGLFAIGCAGGACYTAPSKATANATDENDLTNITYLEIK